MSRRELCFVSLAQAARFDVGVARAEILRSSGMQFVRDPVLSVSLHDNISAVRSALRRAFLLFPLHVYASSGK